VSDLVFATDREAIVHREWYQGMDLHADRSTRCDAWRLCTQVRIGILVSK